MKKFGKKLRIGAVLSALLCLLSVLTVFVTSAASAGVKIAHTSNDFNDASSDYCKYTKIPEGSTTESTYTVGHLGSAANIAVTPKENGKFKSSGTNDGNKYLKLYWDEAGTCTKDPYVDFKALGYPGAADYSEAEFKNSVKSLEYVTLDMDFMSETGVFPNVYLQAWTRYIGLDGTSAKLKTASTAGVFLYKSSDGNYRVQTSKTTSSSTGVKIDSTPYGWNHVTFTIHFDDANIANSTYTIKVNGTVIVNGARYFTSVPANSDYYLGNTSLIGLDMFRVATISNQSIASGANLCFDNVKVNIYTNGYTDQPDEIYTSDYVFPPKQSVARVDDVYYETMSEAIAAIDSSSSEFEIFEDLTAALTVDSPIKVITNGYNFSYTSTKNYIPDVENEGEADEALVFRNHRNVFWHVGADVLCEKYSYGEIPSYPDAYPTTVKIDGKRYNTTGGWALSDLGSEVTLQSATADIHYYIGRESRSVFFTVYDASGNLVKEYNSDNSEPTDITTALSGISDGSTLKLSSDIHLSGSLTVPASKKVYFDLAGNSLVFSYVGTHTYNADGTVKGIDSGKAPTFRISTGCTFYLYSSEAGGKIYNSYYNYETKSLKGQAIIANNGTIKNSNVFIGEVTNGGVTYSGDNLSTYSSNLVYYSTANSTNTVTINGGSYYRTIGDNFAMNILYADAKLIINDALLASNVSGANGALFATYKKTGANDATNPSTMNVELNRCILYTATNLYNEFWYGAKVTFDDCYIASNVSATTPGGTTILLDGNYIGTPSSMNAGVIYNGGVLADTNKAFSLKLDFNKFVYNYNSTTPAASTYNQSSSESYNTVYREILFTKVSAAVGNYETVTWKYDGSTKTEYWHEGATPTSPFRIPDTRSELYSYVPSSDILPAVGGNTVTYEFSQKLTLDVYLSITLHNDFIYNVYIPTEAFSVITSVEIDGEAVSIKDLSTEMIDGEEYSLIKFPIKASRGGETFTVKVYATGYMGKTAVTEYDVSIPAYAEKILDSGYGEKTKSLMRIVLAYVKSACEYFGTDSSSIGEVTNASKVNGTAPYEIPAGVKTLFSGAQLVLDGSIKFRFNIKEGVNSGSAEFTYYVSGDKTTVTLTEKDWKTDSFGRKYCEIPLRARDMLKPITIKVGTSSFSYTFDNYLYNAQNAENVENKDTLLTLLYNMRAYGVAASTFSFTTPEVSLSIAGNPISEYKIVAKTAEETAAAEALRDSISNTYGCYLDIVTENSGKSIVIVNSGISSEHDFAVYVDGEDLVIDSAFGSFIKDGTLEFIDEHIAYATGAVDLDENFTAAYAPEWISYHDFGVAADGVVDDYDKIYFAHTYANKKNIKIRSGEGTFNVGQHNKPIPVKTDVDWTGATFIVDDSGIDPTLHSSIRTSHIFNFVSDYSYLTYTATNSTALNKLPDDLGVGTKNIGFAPGFKALVIFKNDNQYAYNRYGTHGSTGVIQRELVVVDADGNIIEDTELLLDFTGVTSMAVYRIDDEPIVVTGGTFRTIANQAPPVYTSYARGLYFNRANVTIRDTVHTIEGEGETGAPYSGFIYYKYTNNLRCENLTLQGHKSYQDYYEDGTVKSTMGTYDIGGSDSSGIYFYNCVQSNFYRKDNSGLPNPEKTFWGIMGTNYCKNMTYDGCTLTRLDAHAGVYNVNIINSNIAFIKLTGGGVANIINTTVHASAGNSAFVQLRSDYGSTWRGDINIKDCTFKNLTNAPTLVNGTWYNYDFGNYVVTLPNVNIDNLEFTTEPDKVYVFSNIASDGVLLDQPTLSDGTENVNPADIDAVITVKNNKNSYTYVKTANAYIAEKMTLIEE